METLKKMAGFFSLGLSYNLLGLEVLFVLVILAVYTVIHSIWSASTYITELLSPGDGEAVIKDMNKAWKWLFKIVHAEKYQDNID